MATAPPTITPLPDPPSRADPANFVARADAFLGALPDLQDDLDAVAANAYANAQAAQASAVASQASAVNSQASATLSAAQVPLATAQAVAAAASAASAVAAPGTSATSTTSLTPGLGTKAFVTQSGKAFAAGQTLVARSASEPRQWMVGVVTSYVGTALSITATMFGQAPTGGASADWVITFWGAVPSAAKSGQVLRLTGSTPEWGDEGGEAVQILSAENLLLYSEDFANAAWGKDAVALSAPKISGPFGTPTGQLVVGTGAPGGIRLVQAIATSAPTGWWTFSVYVKQGSAQTIAIAMETYEVVGAQGASLEFDFSQASLQCSGSRSVRGDALSLGNGWYRLHVSMLLDPSMGTLYVFFYPGGNAYIAGAQLVRGSSPGLYVPTTTAALSGAGARKRNILINGREADIAAGWAAVNCTKVGKALSPAGDLSATVYEATGTGFNGVPSAAISLEANTQYTLSCYVRSLTGPIPPGGNFGYIEFNNSGSGGPDTSTAIAGGLESITEEWQRRSVTINNVGAVTSNAYLFINLPLGERIAVWGYQLEKGPRASNLIDSGSTPTDGQHADIEARRTHLVDTTYAAVDIAPPADMQPGDWFEVVDVGGNAATNNIKVLRGGLPLIDGVAEDFVIDLNKWSGRFTMDQEKGLVIT